MKKALVLVNPKSRTGRDKIEEIRGLLREAGIEALNELGEKCDFNTTIDRHMQDTDLIVIGGGDGSVNSALKGLLRARKPMLLLPVGTANNLARTLEIPNDLKQAIALASDGRIEWIDVGLANDVPFVNSLGLGLSTQINRFVRGTMKRWLGVWAFIPTALKVALRMSPFRAVVVCDGSTQLITTWQITVCNGRNFGIGLTVDEDASLTDQILHGLSIEVGKWWHVLLLWRDFLTGRFRSGARIRRFKAGHIRIQTRRPMRIDVDGDIKTQTPVEISVLERALPVFVPSPEARPASEPTRPAPPTPAIPGPEVQL